MSSMKPLFDKAMKFPLVQKSKPLPPDSISEDKNLNWGWYNPPQKSIPVEFCLDTSLHGLQYLGQEKRHLLERFFWLAAFLASTITATVLIWGMWSDYQNMPIVTVFSSSETTLDEIPFPSVTICNVNGFQKSVSEEYINKAWKRALSSIPREILRLGGEEKTRQIFASLLDMNNICDSCDTFVDQIVGNHSVIQLKETLKRFLDLNIKKIERYKNPTATLYKVSQPCDKMIMGCIWRSVITDCSQLFQEIVTDYGFCCTFNTIPASLLIKNFSHKKKENSEIVKQWKELDEAGKLSYENLMFSQSPEDQLRKVPLRQKYPGRKAGLSFALNPDLKEYYCTNTDSEGFMMDITAPLEYPRLKDKGIAIRTKSEVFIGVRPEITMSNEGIKSFSLEKRKCYFGGEYELEHYTKYSTSNCLDECIARKVMSNCNCVRYYMPRNYSQPEKLCRLSQSACANEVEAWILENGLNDICPECLPTCTEIEYRREVTVLPLQKQKIEKFQRYTSENLLFSSSQAEEMSIVHVYFDVDSVYPRLRKEFTTLTQLLSNAGGLLGLCMGFSVLSLLEILYYGTIRVCFSAYREKTVAEHKVTNNNTTKNISGMKPLHAQQSWFSKIFNGVSLLGNLDKTEICTVQTCKQDLEFSDDESGDIFKTKYTQPNKLPIYSSSFNEEFHKGFLPSFPEKKLNY